MEEKIPKIGQIFLIMIDFCGYEGLPITQVIERIYEGSGFSKSTIRHNMNALRRFGLVKYGDKNNKGYPTIITGSGEVILKHLDYEDIFVDSVEFY